MLVRCLAVLPLLCTLPQEFDFESLGTFLESTTATDPHAFWPRLERVQGPAGSVLARSTAGAALGTPLAGSDLDRDGRPDLVVVLTTGGLCGAGNRFSSLRALSAVDGREIGRLDSLCGIEPEYLQGSGWLLRSDGCYHRSMLELRPDLRRDALWRMSAEECPIQNPRVACFVDRLRRDGRRGVLIGNAWARDPDSEQPDASVGAVALIDPADGALLWRRFGEQPGAGFGFAVAPAGDWNADGSADVALLVRTIDGTRGPERIVVLSGLDGSPLADCPIDLEARPWYIDPVGDLDGDGAFELHVHGAPRGAFVLGSRARAPLDVTGGWKLAWAAADGDLDGDGFDDLVLGRIEPAPVALRKGERRVSIYSRAGLEDLPDLPLEALPWKNTRARLTRLAPERAWDLHLVRSGAAIVGQSEWLVVPGPAAR